MKSQKYCTKPLSELNHPTTPGSKAYSERRRLGTRVLITKEQDDGGAPRAERGAGRLSKGMQPLCALRLSNSVCNVSVWLLLCGLWRARISLGYANGIPLYHPTHLLVEKRLRWGGTYSVSVQSEGRSPFPD